MFPLMIPLAAAVGGLVYGASKEIEKAYPPQSDAPKIGTIVTKTLPDGSKEDYVVVTYSGHDTPTCEKIKNLVDERKVEKPLYHAQDKRIPQRYARTGGSVITIGMNPKFKPEDLTGFELYDQRYENSGFFPLGPDELNNKVPYSKDAPNPSLRGEFPKFTILHEEQVTRANKIGLFASLDRMWHPGKEE
jgi:hypothetical protein